jgi:transposase
MPRTRRPYPSDLTNQEWNLLEPLLASPERRGRPPKWPTRRVADAVFYLLLRSGCAWSMLPREYPPWQTIYYHFRKWASTTGCGKPTTGCVKRCARRKGAPGTRAGQ